MSPKLSDKVTPEQIEAKRIFDQYRQIKLLLDYVRQPQIEKLLEKMEGSSFALPKPIIRKRSRI